MSNQHGTLDALCRIPHPLTPREKAELKPCPFCGGEAWLNDYEAKYSDLPPKSRCPQCKSCGASLGYLTTPARATEAWNRRAALASGSGDHAELAKRLRASKRDRHGIYGRVLVNPDGPAAADAIEALIAENAALRGSLTKANDGFEEYERKFYLEQDAREEAERKLAEAVGLLREARDEIQAHADGATPEWQRRVYDSSRSDYAQDMDIPNRIDAWLSKEAERG